jgi:molybdopterin converting factor subunit 1
VSGEAGVRVRVRLFASLREAAGAPERRLTLPAGATTESAWQALVGDLPALAPRRASLAVAVNRAYSGFEVVLQDGDEVAFIPPVSGG